MSILDLGKQLELSKEAVHDLAARLSLDGNQQELSLFQKSLDIILAYQEATIKITMLTSYLIAGLTTFKFVSSVRFLTHGPTESQRAINDSMDRYGTVLGLLQLLENLDGKAREHVFNSIQMNVCDWNNIVH